MVPAAAVSAFVMHGGGYDGPPQLTPATALTQWELDPLVISLLVLTAGLYLWGVVRLRRAGHAWPVGRTLAFVVGGVGSGALATVSFLGAYDGTLFSDHMVQHMILSMVTPIFLALGAPVTLALRTLPRGGRKVVLAVVHSRVARVLTFPVVAGTIFVLTPFVLYFTTGFYEATLRNEWLHDVTHLHFVVTGMLFFVPLLGIDPVPNRMPHVIRLLSAFVILPFHAFLGIAIMSRTTVIAGGYYAELHRIWGASPLSDQHTAGGILWASGDLVGLLIFAAFFVQWMRADERAAARADRWADRRAAQVAGGEAVVDDELAAYNAYLASLAARDAGPA